MNQINQNALINEAEILRSRRPLAVGVIILIGAAGALALKPEWRGQALAIIGMEPRTDLPADMVSENVPAALDAVAPAVYRDKFLVTKDLKNVAADDRQLYADFNRIMGILDGWDGRQPDLDKAEAMIESGLERAPRLALFHAAKARLELARAYVQGTRYDLISLENAQRTLNEAVRLEPRYAAIHVVQMEIHLARGYLSKVHRIAAYLRPVPAYRDAAMSLDAQALAREGSVSQAIRIQEQLLAKEGYARSAAAELAGLYARSGQHKLAEKFHRRAVKDSPKAAWPLHNYAVYLQGRGRLDDAIAQARKANAAMEYEAGRDLLGGLLYQKGKDLLWTRNEPGEARKYFKESLKVDPENIDALYGIGAILAIEAQAAKDQVKARESAKYLGQYLAQRPDDRGAKRLLTRIEIFAEL